MFLMAYYFLCFCMPNECQKYTTSRPHLRAMGRPELEAFFCRMQPDEAFRFITFQGDDYRQHKLTFLLFNYLPQAVYVTVEQPTDIESAIEELVLLNPGVEWDCIQLHYFNNDDAPYGGITAELKLVLVHMRVNRKGKLIYRL